MTDYTLTEAVAYLGKNAYWGGDTLILRDGVYEIDSLVIAPSGTRKGLTICAEDGARPIIVGTDGYPPSVSVGSNVTIRGVWFGGNRPADNTGSRTIVIGSGSTMEDCVLFNYINGIQNGSDAHGNTYRRIKFVNCGYEFYHHPIYVANFNSSLPEHGVLTEDCIVVGGEGFGVHYYHQPSYGVAQYNFIGGTQNALALQGDGQGPVSGNYNIIWGVSGVPLYRSTALGSCDGNVWYSCGKPDTPGSGNYFIAPVETSGTDPVVWQVGDVLTNLGHSVDDINTAVTSTLAAFSGKTAAQVHASEISFALFESVILNWKANSVQPENKHSANF